jgi:hypothetical protein
MAQSRLKSAADTHTKDQSYYTAYSVARRIAEWLVTDDPDPLIQPPRFSLINSIKPTETDPLPKKQFDFTEAMLGAGMGNCHVDISFAESDQAEIIITATAIKGEESTVLSAKVTTPVRGVDAMIDVGNDAVPSVYTIPRSGVYRLEVWGAQGGNALASGNFTTRRGGYGGYSYGEVYLEEGTILTLRGGGAGVQSTGTGTISGGYNGGGSLTGVASGTGGSGGGASDIQLGDTSAASNLYARLIVAGGGGGGSNINTSNHGTGGYAGGPAGSAEGVGGTQTSGGSGGGSFGLGGNGSAAATGAGGGGWYGGGARNAGMINGSAGGGGSGWVYTQNAYNTWAGIAGATAVSSMAAAGLTGDIYLGNTKLLSGNQDFPAADGSGIYETGHSGNGYARVTLIEENDDNMPPTNVTPNIGPTTGGQAVTVSGKNFTQPGNTTPDGLSFTGSYNYVADDLVIYLDALNKDGLGDGERSSDSAALNTWKDLSGNGNDFEFVGNPTINTRSVFFNGSGQYAVSKSEINLTQYESFTVEVTFKEADSSKQGMVFEYSPNWNKNLDGFGAFLNSIAGGFVNQRVHTNNGSIIVRNYAWNNVAGEYQTHTNIRSRIVDPEGRLTYINGVRVPFTNDSQGTGTSTPNVVVPAGRAYKFYLAARFDTNNSGNPPGPPGLFFNGDISSVRVYGKKLNDQEIKHNDETDDFRFRNPPVVMFGGAPATDVVVVNPTTIKCKTPAHAEGLVSCDVSFPAQNGQLPQISPNAYLYVDDSAFNGRYSVTSIKSDITNTNISDSRGGDTVTIKGKNFLYPPNAGADLEPYVAGGMFLHWDGINNNGDGYSETAHRNNITSWKDISTGPAYNGDVRGTDTITNHWDPQAFKVGDPSATLARWVYSSAFPNVDVATAEIVVKPPDTGQQNTIGFNTGSNDVSGTWGSGNMWWNNGYTSANFMFQYRDGTGTLRDYVASNAMQSQTYLYNSSAANAGESGVIRAKNVYLTRNADFSQAVYPGYDTSNYVYVYNGNSIWQNTTNQMRPWNVLRLETVLTNNNAKNQCDYYSVRLYNRILTASEIAQNHTADIDRFLGLEPISIVIGDTQIHATNVRVIDDETITCTMPAHAQGPVDIRVNLYGKELLLTSAYQYSFDPKDAIKWNYGN